MPIRKPTQVLLDYNDSGNVGATSVVSKTFTIPQDTDSLVIKLVSSSVNGTAPTADVYLQTSDDGGTTWYDQSRISVPATTVSSVLSNTNAKALWDVAVTAGTSDNLNTGSIVGNASMRGLGSNQHSGLPILGTLGQVQISYGGTITTNNGLRVQVLANSGSVGH